MGARRRTHWSARRRRGPHRSGAPRFVARCDTAPPADPTHRPSCAGVECAPALVGGTGLGNTTPDNTTPNGTRRNGTRSDGTRSDGTRSDGTRSDGTRSDGAR
ncbi:MAG: hypothetical protein ACRDTF_10895, partial [Pseudonocardiaceae bacterium]